MQTRPGVEAKLVSISLVWRRKRPSKETVAYIHTHEHTQTHKEHAFLRTYTQTHTRTHAHTQKCTHKHKHTHTYGESHEQNANRYTHAKTLITHGCLHTHIHT